MRKVILLFMLLMGLNSLIKAQVGSINPEKTGAFSIVGFPVPQTFTMECWTILKKTSSLSLFTWKNATTAGGCEIKSSATGQLQFIGYNTGTSSSIIVDGVGQSPCTYGPVHIAVVVIPGAVKLYVNGNLAASSTMHNSIVTTTDATFTAVAAQLPGLDELRFWNIERTAEQIKAGMAAPLTIGNTDATDLNLLAYYNFDRNTTGVVIDECSSVGTINGSLPAPTATVALSVAGAYQDNVNFATPAIVTNPSTNTTIPIVALRDSIGSSVGVPGAELPPFLVCNNITQTGTIYCAIVSSGDTKTYSANNVISGISDAVGNYKFPSKGLVLNKRLKFAIDNNPLIKNESYKVQVVLVNEQGQASPVYTSADMTYRGLFIPKVGDEKNILVEVSGITASTISYNETSYTLTVNNNQALGIFNTTIQNNFYNSVYGLPITGDFDVKAKISSAAGTNKATGLLAIENNCQFSPFVATAWSTIAGPGPGQSGQWVRKAFGDVSLNANNNAAAGGVAALTNKWFRLVRKGDYFASYSSTDDITYTLYGPAQYAPISKSLKVGVFTLGANNIAASVLFSDLTFITNAASITDNFIPVITSQPVSVSICSGVNTTFSVAATATGASFTYQWQVSTDNGVTFANVATNTLYTGVTSTTLNLTNVPYTYNGYHYKCIITNGTGKGAGVLETNVVVLTVNGGQTTNIVATGLCLTNTLRFTNNAIGGKSPLTYSWTGPNAFVSSDKNPSIANVDANAVGQYKVVITDAASCTLTSSITINAINTNTSPIASVSTSNSNFCSGVTTTITASTGASYLWSTGATSTSIVTGNPGIYTVIVSDVNNCSSEASQSIVVNAIPTFSIIENSGAFTNDGIICTGATVTLMADISGATYKWSNGATSQSISVSEAGVYHLEISENSCTNTSVSKSIIVNSVPVASITALGVDVCSPIATLTAVGGGTYLWNTGETTASVTKTVSGNYSVTVLNNGCSVQTSQTVVKGPISTVSLSASTTKICSGQFASITATASAGTLLWSNGISGINEITVGDIGSYSVVLTDINNCQVSSSIVISGYIAKITPSNPSICIGSSITLTCTEGGSSYVWTQNDGSDASNTLSSLSIINNPVISTPTSTITYKVSVVDGTTGCTGEASVTVTVNAYPTATFSESSGISVDDNTVCNGDKLTATLVDGATYLWSGGIVATNTLTINTTSDYYVDVTKNGCTARSDVKYITIVPLPNPVVGTAASYSCGGTYLNVPGGSAYLWSPSEGLSSITSGAPFADPKAETIYNVVVTNSYGCVKSATETVTVKPAKPTYDIVVSDYIKHTVKAINVMPDNTSGFGYSWTFGEKAESATNTLFTSYLPQYSYEKNGNYIVGLKVKDLKNCYSDTTAKYVSFMTTVASVSTINTVSVFPNPNNGHFSISISSKNKSGNGVIKISNELGKIVNIRSVEIYNGANFFNYDLILAKGIYFIEIKWNGDVKTEKMLVK